MKPNRSTILLGVGLVLALLGLTAGFVVLAIQIGDIKKSIATFGDNSYVKSIVREEVSSAVAALPTPKDGKDGADGTDGDSIQGPKGDKGDSVKGPRGEKGEDAKPCTTSRQENGALIECPDGSSSVVEDGQDARQTEPCKTLLILDGWRYVGSKVCFPTVRL